MGFVLSYQTTPDEKSRETQRERDGVYAFRKSNVCELLTSRPLITAFPTILWLSALPVRVFEVFHLEYCNSWRKQSVSIPVHFMLSALLTGFQFQMFSC